MLVLLAFVWHTHWLKYLNTYIKSWIWQKKSGIREETPLKNQESGKRPLKKSGIRDMATPIKHLQGGGGGPVGYPWPATIQWCCVMMGLKLFTCLCILINISVDNAACLNQQNCLESCYSVATFVYTSILQNY